MQQATQIIKRPLITEKSTWEADRHNRYSFEVDRDASKPQIKWAVEQVYGVRVVDVAVQVRKPKRRRTRYGYTDTGGFKKAVVVVHPEDRIDLF